MSDLSLMCELSDLLASKLDVVLKYRSEFEFKADTSPVSEADLIIDRFIKSFFEERLGSVQFISEEDKDHTFYTNHEFTVLIDPLDGTENFISGLPIWGISIGLWQHQKNIDNLLYFPELKISITKDSIPSQRFNSRIAGFSSTINEQLINSIEIGKESRILGASSFNIYCMLIGAFKSFTNPGGAWIWDFLPGANLCLNAGLKVMVEGKPYNGEFLDVSRKHRFVIAP